MWECLGWIDLDWLPGIQQGALSFPLRIKTWEEYSNEKLMGQDRKSTHQLSSQEKQSHCGENGFNLLLIIHREKKVRNQKKQKTPSTHPSSSETKLCP